MKNIIFILALLLAFTSHAFSQSVMNYQAGTSIEVQTGADICADQVDINGTFSGGGTICGGVAYVLNLNAYIQGFYDASTNTMVPDTVVIYLRNAVTPFAKIDSAKSILNSSGVGAFHFFNVSNGTNYYLSIRHRNSIETWSKNPQQFTASMLSYDFTTANTQAFGDNMIQVDASPVRFAVFGGDVSQDGTVDATDVSTVDNDAANFVGGYVVTDLTGDNFVDGTDFAIADNNAANFVSVIRP